MEFAGVRNARALWMVKAEKTVTCVQSKVVTPRARQPEVHNQETALVATCSRTLALQVMHCFFPERLLSPGQKSRLSKESSR